MAPAANPWGTRGDIYIPDLGFLGSFSKPRICVHLKEKHGYIYIYIIYIHVTDPQTDTNQQKRRVANKRRPRRRDNNIIMVLYCDLQKS